MSVSPRNDDIENFFDLYFAQLFANGKDGLTEPITPEKFANFVNEHADRAALGFMASTAARQICGISTRYQELYREASVPLHLLRGHKLPE
ncbi:MAG TPA: hypothetical protein IAC45_00505 [Candidatus Aphodousia faecavium]|nr:hypothetical protein [Candidatus Aphodousia faecavium]